MVSTRTIGLPHCDICGQPAEKLYHCNCSLFYCSNCGVVDEDKQTVCKVCIDYEDEARAVVADYEWEEAEAARCDAESEAYSKHMEEQCDRMIEERLMGE